MFNKCYNLADPEKSVNTVYHDFDQIYEEQSAIDFKNGIGNKTDHFGTVNAGKIGFEIAFKFNDRQGKTIEYNEKIL